MLFHRHTLPCSFKKIPVSCDMGRHLTEESGAGVRNMMVNLN